MDLDQSQIKCYDADFMELDGEFAHTFKNGVLTIKADFAEQISGLMIDDSAHDTIYRLRYLDSPQFAWLADTLWYDYGWMELGDAERYYSEAELQAQADKANEERQETLDLFALLEGTWVSEDGMQKYVFSTDEDGSGLIASEAWYNETEQNWVSLDFIAKSAFQSEYCGAMGDADLIDITLCSRDPSAADLYILYDPQNHIIQVNDTVYHWTASPE